MKKLLLASLVIFFFAGLNSCEIEPADINNLESVSGKGRLNKSKSEEDNCETAFGRICDCPNINNCFSDFGINRWGWSVELNGAGSGPFNLFAGAGQCDLNKGTYVGKVHITFNPDGTLTYGDVELEPGYELQEFHFYSGDSEMPLKKNGRYTAAPGQYTNYGDVNGDGKVYVIVHASVCAVN